MEKNSTKYKILNTAAACFSKNGFHKTSVDEIAALANIAKGSVYYNFNSKENLLFNVIKWGIEILNDDVNKVYQEDLSEEETFYKVLKAYTKMSMNYPELSALVFNSISDTISDESAAKINYLYNGLIDSTVNLLKYGSDSGFVKDMNFHLVAVGMFGLINNMCSYYRKHLKNENPKIVYETIFQTFYSGIVNDKGSIK